MMTTQTKHFVDLPDIMAVRLECKNCQSSFLVSLRRASKLPYACVNCGDALWDDPDSLALKAIENFIAIMKKIGPLMEKQPVNFSVEVNLPESTVQTK